MATQSEDRVVVETPSKKRWRLPSFGICVTVVAAALVGFQSRGNFGLVVGTIGLVIFAPITVASLIRAVRNRPVLVLDASGLTDRSSLVGGGFVPWQEVQRIEDRQVRRRIFVTVKVTDRAAFLARQPAWRRLLRRLNGEMTAGEILIPDSMLPMRPAELVSTMRQMQRAAQRKGTSRRA
jgi:hypothetical protein